MKLKLELDDIDAWLRRGPTCQNVVFQSIDLRPYDAALARLPQASRPQDNCLALGCELGPEFAAALARSYGLIFPDIPGKFYRAYRSSLYTTDELFAGYDPARPESYFECLDWQIYQSFIKIDEHRRPLRPIQYVDNGPDEVLARRLHDHFIEEETDEFLSHFVVPNGRGIVAIMGGHDTLRSDASYQKIAELSRTLTREGFLIATGGGPGLMEAANLGAYFAPRDDGALLVALGRMRTADRYDDPNWLRTAWEIRRDFVSPDLARSRSFGVPTWFYGHEPPNVFATSVAKYFENSLREEGLLAIATHGIVFADGNGGTVQEIFQNACQNYYRNYGFARPMILFNEEFWNPAPEGDGNYLGKRKPAWPLLRKLAIDGKFDSLVALTSDSEVALALIRGFRAPGQTG